MNTYYTIARSPVVVGALALWRTQKVNTVVSHWTRSSIIINRSPEGLLIVTMEIVKKVNRHDEQKHKNGLRHLH